MMRCARSRVRTHSLSEWAPSFMSQETVEQACAEGIWRRIIRGRHESPANAVHNDACRMLSGLLFRFVAGTIVGRLQGTMPVTVLN